LSLGGEQSGHIIFSTICSRGRPLHGAERAAGRLSGRPLADLASDLTTYPQVLLNVVRERTD
jgi:phosphoglucosamine mutase